MKPVIPPAPKPRHMAEIAAIRAELDGKVQGSSEKKRFARNEYLYDRLCQLSPADMWYLHNPAEAVSPRGERIYHVRTLPVSLPGGGLAHRHIYSTVMNSPGKGKFNFDYEGVGYELRGLDWETGLARPWQFIPYDWGNLLTRPADSGNLAAMPNSPTSPRRAYRIRQAYIKYRLELAGSNQKAVAQLARTTPATVSRVIAGVRVKGDKSEAVWSALRKCAECPVHVLKSPPPPVDLPRAR